jgi:hypothetical protein
VPKNDDVSDDASALSTEYWILRGAYASNIDDSTVYSMVASADQQTSTRIFFRGCLHYRCVLELLK